MLILYQTGWFKSWFHVEEEDDETSKVTISTLHNQLGDLNHQMTKLGGQLDALSNFVQRYLSDSNNVTQELKSIKSLLVGRSQFPSVPKLPEWQTKKNHSNGDIQVQSS